LKQNENNLIQSLLTCSGLNRNQGEKNVGERAGILKRAKTLGWERTDRVKKKAEISSEYAKLMGGWTVTDGKEKKLLHRVQALARVPKLKISGTKLSAGDESAYSATLHQHQPWSYHWILWLMEQKLASLLEPSREKKLKGEATPSLPLKCPWLFHLITFFITIIIKL
jgi:hypothetical protein